ncbi:MAG: hypothetical protein WD276_03010 [Actinomycetota bacterium]
MFTAGNRVRHCEMLWLDGDGHTIKSAYRDFSADPWFPTFESLQALQRTINEGLAEEEPRPSEGS